MIGKKITAIAIFTMVLGDTAGLAATPSGGLASNRAALALPTDQEGGNAPACVAGTPDCPPAAEPSTAHSGGGKLYILLGGLAAAGAIAGAASGGHGHHHPVSP